MGGPIVHSNGFGYMLTAMLQVMALSESEVWPTLKKLYKTIHTQKPSNYQIWFSVFCSLILLRMPLKSYSNVYLLSEL